ncbi:MAG: AraC family transcriptional regulator [Pseudomonadota bacterium]
MDKPVDTSKLWLSYEDRMDRVVTYIHDHLDEELDLMTLAAVACLSPHHWHRIYAAMKGETIAQTVRRLRLARAARDLMATKLPIADVARKSGYPNLQSFSRVFSEHYGMPPAQYRKEGNHVPFEHATAQRIISMFDVTIKDAPAMTLAGVPHKGDYMAISKSFERTFGALSAQDLASHMRGMVGVYYDDPDAVLEAELRSFAGAVLAEEADLAAPLDKLDVPAGRVAVLHYKGPYAAMKPAYDWLYGTWLPQSGEEVRDAPAYEIYLNNPEDTAPQDLLTDIHMPLR